LIINYDESIARVYASLVQAIVVPTRRLEILQECNSKRTNDFPSWVPDWTTNYYSKFGVTYYLYRASAEMDAQFSFSEDLSIMTVKGFAWDELRISRGKPLFKWNELKFRHSVEAVFSIIELIVRAEFIITDNLNRLTFRRKKTKIQGIETETQALFQVKHDAKCLGFDQDFIRTSRGYLGKLIPSSSNFCEGDRICILLGCPVPMVLRKIQTTTSFRDKSMLKESCMEKQWLVWKQENVNCKILSYTSK
jgi:hypothetical protein